MPDDAPEAFDARAEYAFLTASMAGGYAFLDPELDDTNVVVLATSAIEKFLQLLMLLQFAARPSKNAFNEVFRGNGPLATFAAKISLATALGIIQGDVAHDLRVLKKIRNDFAHSPTRKFLGEIQACLSLKLTAETPRKIVPEERRRFVESAAEIVARLGLAACASMAERAIVVKHLDEIKDLAASTVDWMFAGAKGKGPLGLS
jgi:hypothetical protein